MKLKKISLFILIFLAFLFISNNVNGYVVSECGVDKYYLNDLPFSEENYKTVFLLDEINNTIMLLGCFNGSSIGYDNTTGFLYHSNNSDNTANNLFKVYFCSLELVNDKYVGGTWQGVSSSDSGYSMYSLSNPENYRYIGGTTAIFPSCEFNIIQSLPDIEGLTWQSDFLISKIPNNDTYIANLFVPEITYSNAKFRIENSNNPHLFRYSTSSSTNSNIQIYSYNITTGKWEYSSTTNRVNSVNQGCDIRYNIVFSNVDIYTSYDSEDIAHPKLTLFFNSIYAYSTFPYILNSAEDLALGNDDIVIMPR